MLIEMLEVMSAVIRAKRRGIYLLYPVLGTGE